MRLLSLLTGCLSFLFALSCPYLFSLFQNIWPLLTPIDYRRFVTRVFHGLDVENGILIEPHFIGGFPSSYTIPVYPLWNAFVHPGRPPSHFTSPLLIVYTMPIRCPVSLSFFYIYIWFWHHDCKLCSFILKIEINMLEKIK